MRAPMDRSRRLTDGTRRWTFMRSLLLDDLMTSYTNARPGVGLCWSASSLDRLSPSMASFLKRTANAFLCAQALVDSGNAFRAGNLLWYPALAFGAIHEQK